MMMMMNTIYNFSKPLPSPRSVSSSSSSFRGDIVDIVDTTGDSSKVIFITVKLKLLVPNNSEANCC